MKAIILALFVVFASASYYQGVGNATTPTGQLLQGICDVLQIANDTDVDDCADVPLVQDIEQLVNDLNNTIPNPLALIEDADHLLNDYEQMKTTCPEVADAFGTFFSNFTTAFENAKLKTLEKVFDNMKNNFTGVAADIADFAENISGNDYYDAGSDFGYLIQVLLVGWI